MERKVSVIQENGQVTLPVEFRKSYGLERGDVVVFRQTEEGLLISPRESLVMKLMDQIGDVLSEQGVTLDQLMQPDTVKAKKTKRAKEGAAYNTVAAANS